MNRFFGISALLQASELLVQGQYPQVSPEAALKQGGDIASVDDRARRAAKTRFSLKEKAARALPPPPPMSSSEIGEWLVANAAGKSGDDLQKVLKEAQEKYSAIQIRYPLRGIENLLKKLLFLKEEKDRKGTKLSDAVRTDSSIASDSQRKEDLSASSFSSSKEEEDRKGTKLSDAVRTDSSIASDSQHKEDLSASSSSSSPGLKRKLTIPPKRQGPIPAIIIKKEKNYAHPATRELRFLSEAFLLAEIGAAASK